MWETYNLVTESSYVFLSITFVDKLVITAAEITAQIFVHKCNLRQYFPLIWHGDLRWSGGQVALSCVWRIASLLYRTFCWILTHFRKFCRLTRSFYVPDDDCTWLHTSLVLFQCSTCINVLSFPVDKQNSCDNVKENREIFYYGIAIVLMD